MRRAKTSEPLLLLHGLCDVIECGKICLLAKMLTSVIGHEVMSLLSPKKHLLDPLPGATTWLMFALLPAS